MTPPMFGQPWRQAMQMPQQSPFQGGGMPTRGPGGGWQMPAMPRPVQGPTSVQPPPPQAPPMMGQQPQSFAPDIAKLLQNMPGMGFGSGYGGDYGGWGNVGSVGHDSGMGYSAGY